MSKLLYRGMPRHAGTLYSELLEAVLYSELAALGIGSTKGSFVKKRVRTKDYLYYQSYESESKKQIYLGPISEKMEKVLSEVDSTKREHSAISNSLLAAGGHRLDPALEPVIEKLARTGIFLSGGVLVGTATFACYQNMLNVKWPEALSTNDVDVVMEDNPAIAIPDEAAVSKKMQQLRKNWKALSQIMNPEWLPTSFKEGEVRIDFLTPMAGPQKEKPTKLKRMSIEAMGLRHLNYLIEEPVECVIPTLKGGYLVRVPRPERYAIHKMIVSECRKAREGEKSKKDLRQAEYLISYFFEHGPDQIREAWKNAIAHGPKWKNKVNAASKKMPSDMIKRLNSK
ncbi:MAG: hypothetical protein JKX97_07480 [Candidatus Lindowbacteria bacterium]|nr:hypothetical protein [Candidatus Lindowbacteria bacterium]